MIKHHPFAAILFIMLLAMAADSIVNLAVPAKRIRIYEVDNGWPKYKGYIEVPDNANRAMRIYDKKGRYRGRIEEDKIHLRKKR